MPNSGETLFHHPSQNQKRHPNDSHDGCCLPGLEAGNEKQDIAQGRIAGGRTQRFPVSGQIRDAKGRHALGELYARDSGQV